MPNKKKRQCSTTRSPKKSKKPLRVTPFGGGELTTPTKSEWEQMSRFQTFVVDDNTGHEHRFSVQSYALVLPEGANPDGSLHLRDFWVGKIKAIRSRNDDPKDVWVELQWLWSVQEVIRHTRVDAASFGNMERLLSNHHDFVHTSCFADTARVVPYVECDAEPPAISDETFYYRYTFDVRTMKVIEASVTCFCGEAYNANETGVMHFCPRKGCSRPFHAECLQEGRYVEKPRRNLRSLQLQRQLQFERTLPDGEDEDELRDSEELQEPGTRALRSNSLIDHRSHHKDIRRDQLESHTHRVDRHFQVPADLLALARSPMVKGIGTDLPYEWSCVAGNYAVVIRARRIVRDVVEGGKPVPKKWRSMLEIPGASYGEEGRGSWADVENIDVKSWVVSDKNLFLCPSCKGAI